METKVLKIINEIRANKNIPVLESISVDDKLRDDLDFTSFDLAELTVKIEDEYDVDIFADGLVNTIGEIFEKLR